MRSFSLEKAREFAKADLGNESWTKSLQEKVRDLSSSDLGALIVANAVMQDAYDVRQKALAEEYATALGYLEQDDYGRASYCFAQLGGFRDSEEKATLAGKLESERQQTMARARALIDEKRYGWAVSELEALGNYRGAVSLLDRLKRQDLLLRKAHAAFDLGNYSEALRLLDGAGDYRDSLELRDAILLEEKRHEAEARRNSIELSLAKHKEERRGLRGYLSSLEELDSLKSPKKNLYLQIALNSVIAFLVVGPVSLYGLFSGSILWTEWDSAVGAFLNLAILLSIGLSFAWIACLIIGLAKKYEQMKTEQRAAIIRESLPTRFAYTELGIDDLRANRSSRNRQFSVELSKDALEKRIGELDSVVAKLESELQEIASLMD
ncbi:MULTISPECIES: hypothetical protein [unclassified Adlercreutzia]|uniref:hypothetical protein n=1 Tax=unclassified Adlercreutzia TaxID=2636013 RepID=UPI0013EA0CDC|nr:MULTISPECIES: hypothetical protein [unclassified Adlercreutzia]